MGTTTYFDQQVRDAASDKVIGVQLGTTGFAGDGPQLFVGVGVEKFVMSHADAEKFCEAAADIARYFSYKT